MSITDIFNSWTSLFPRIRITNIFEILIIAFLVYEILIWIKNTRAWVLLRGLVFIFAFTIFAAIFRLDTILWILGKIATIAVTALIIVFQPELRKALEQLGSKNILTNFFAISEVTGREFSEKTINELVKASYELAKTRTGALMVIEQQVSLKEFERTGIEINGIVTSQLLVNIFEHNTPLHDGAVVICGNEITAATCYLPLSDNPNISKTLGTRHRAAIGVSEVTDSITIVVSEESGGVSVARGGMLSRMYEQEELRRILNGLSADSGNTTMHRFKIWKGKPKNERKTY